MAERAMLGNMLFAVAFLLGGGTLAFWLAEWAIGLRQRDHSDRQ
jgi:hypothetical protein